MNLSYRKSSNGKLFDQLAPADTGLGIKRPQNYVPIYRRLFDLTSSNCGSFNLDHKYHMVGIGNRLGPTAFEGTVQDAAGGSRRIRVFFKLAPVLDPLRYLMGRYDKPGFSVTDLPRLGDTSPGHPKIRDSNNSAYVDAFFTFLSSRLLHDYRFVHGMDYYGSCMAIKSDFPVDVSEDMDMIAQSDFFSRNEDVLFRFADPSKTVLGIGGRSGARRERLDIAQPIISNAPTASISDLAELDEVFSAPVETRDEGIVLVDHLSASVKTGRETQSSHSSRCSSRSSATSRGSARGRDTDCCDGTSSVSGSDFSTATEDTVTVNISSFPVQAVAMECCEGTLDALAAGGHLGECEWESAIFQVGAALWGYQRAFDLTHNDLHANNIMFSKTDRKYLHYKWGGRHYRVPTFGKVYKIIDYGRAIYSYRGLRMCSDSFHPKGDAASQYNCEPYLNPDKPVIDPNPSFDLCRLGCSLYDFIMDDLCGRESRAKPIQRLIMSWCLDDKGRNVMYKSSGVERYPEFKLYKMIVRTVHKHDPASLLRDSCFGKYIVPRKSIPRKAPILALDSIPEMHSLPT